MVLTVLDTDFNTVTVLDGYKSLVWKEPFCGYGDFELYAPVNTKSFDDIKIDYYILNRESEHVMIVEDIETETDLELGSYIRITGRSLESILDRRIIWEFRICQGNLQTNIQGLLNECIINPLNDDRQIPNFIFQSTNDTRITGLLIDHQYTGDNLGEVINGLCEEAGIGYKVILNDNNQFVFSLYAGVDRSYDQDKNSYVVFSPKFENLINSNYYKSKANLKNVTLIGGADEEIEFHNKKIKQRVYATYGSGYGLQRRELFSDARDISLTDEEGEDIPKSQYITMLQNRGRQNLLDYVEIETFEGEVEATQMFVYKEDFYLGDIVQIANEYGKEAKTRITEMVTSDDENGFAYYPTFTILQI